MTTCRAWARLRRRNQSNYTRMSPNTNRSQAQPKHGVANWIPWWRDASLNCGSCTDWWQAIEADWWGHYWTRWSLPCTHQRHLLETFCFFLSLICSFLWKCFLLTFWKTFIFWPNWILRLSTLNTRTEHFSWTLRGTLPLESKGFIHVTYWIRWYNNGR